jgi:hypothetical protein
MSLAQLVKDLSHKTIEFRTCSSKIIQSKLCIYWVMVFNATYNNISAVSWLSVLLVEETGVPR